MSQMTVILLAYILTCSSEVWEIIHLYLGMVNRIMFYFNCAIYCAVRLCNLTKAKKKKQLFSIAGY